MLAFLLMIADPAAMIAAARVRTAPEQPCVASANETDITVCGLRGADRFRVPFVPPEPGDPRREGVPAERVRLLNRTNPVKQLSPFLVESGMAGTSVGTTFGASGSRAFVRKPAP